VTDFGANAGFATFDGEKKKDVVTLNSDESFFS
jgi:hypothetical protein